jgi:hypothetical protein
MADVTKERRMNYSAANRVRDAQSVFAHFWQSTRQPHSWDPKISMEISGKREGIPSLCVYGHLWSRVLFNRINSN